ncbi:MAG: amidohydrolase family protein [Rhodobacteraceae bacterium]|nr:amidohydrolase family protein [Paracoccaceae bacterium]
MSAAPILFRNVRLLDLDVESGMTQTCDLVVRDGRIFRTGSDLAAPDGAHIVEGRGDLLMPGLVNAHFHSSVTHMKGRLPCLPLEIFMLYESPALEALRPTPREAYLRTMLGCMEMLQTGTTAVQDDCFFVPEPTTEIIDAVCQAYLDSGMRATIALDEPELSEIEKLPFLGTLVPPELRERLSRRPQTGKDDLLALYDYLIGTWHGAHNGRIQAAVSCSAPQRVTPDYFAALDALSRRHNLPFFAHVLETKLQRVLGIEEFSGRSLVQYIEDLGGLSDRMTLIHGIWVDGADLDLLAHRGASVAHNPISNLRLGSGVMPFRAMRDRGISVCLGIDEAIADDAVNMWSVMKTAGMIHTLTGDDYASWPSAREILTAATQAGGQAMRRPDLGTLKHGAPADLILVDLSTLAFLPLNDLPRQLVHVELGQSVRLTMVSGRIVMDGGRLQTVDQEALMQEAREVFANREPALMEAAEQMRPLLPYYDAMYRRACATDVGMARKLGAWPS